MRSCLLRFAALLQQELDAMTEIEAERALAQLGFDELANLTATTATLAGGALTHERPVLKKALTQTLLRQSSRLNGSTAHLVLVLASEGEVDASEGDVALSAAKAAVKNVPDSTLPMPRLLPAGAYAAFGTGGGVWDEEEANGGAEAPAGAAVRAALRRCSSALPPEAFRARLQTVVEQLREPDYTARRFHDDMVACFPELQLYLVNSGGEGDVGDGGSDPGIGQSTTSGRSADDEYKRTIGALFSVYWLMRLDLPHIHASSGLDGKRGWTFGAVDATTWVPPSEASVSALRRSLSHTHAENSNLAHDNGAVRPAEAFKSTATCTKQLAFYDELNWSELHQLLVDAQLLTPGDKGRCTVNVQRTAAMLALTAIHDIMKIDSLLPTVQPSHAPYSGFGAGAVINDHDIALGYVLHHDAEALPSFASLTRDQKKPVEFTQAKLGFNHGWLVQAEAPPGALFSSFKRLLDEGGVADTDIAFYFVHCEPCRTPVPNALPRTSPAPLCPSPLASHLSPLPE